MKRGYHHGNLRQALVEAALSLIAEKGPQGLTLSEAAKAADVTPAAVYRHLPDARPLGRGPGRVRHLAAIWNTLTKGARPHFPLSRRGAAYLAFAASTRPLRRF